VRRLRGEGREGAFERRVEKIVPFDAGSADDLAEHEPAQAGGHDVFRQHARQRAEIDPLRFAEFGCDNAGAERPNPLAARVQLLMQRLRQRDDMGQRPNIGGSAARVSEGAWAPKASIPATLMIVPSPLAAMPGAAARASIVGATTLT
jgi:hypothetical protein